MKKHNLVGHKILLTLLLFVWFGVLCCIYYFLWAFGLQQASSNGAGDAPSALHFAVIPVIITSPIMVAIYFVYRAIVEKNVQQQGILHLQNVADTIAPFLDKVTEKQGTEIVTKIVLEAMAQSPLMLHHRQQQDRDHILREVVKFAAKQ